MSERKILLKQYSYPHVKLFSTVPSKRTRLDTIIYAQDLPKDAKYHVEITLKPHTHIGSGKKRKNAKSMFVCNYGKRVGFGVNHVGFPSRLDCEVCEWSCKHGRLTSPVEFGLFDGYGCTACGFEYEGFYQFGSPCQRCGADSVVALTRGNPHIHGLHWVFQLHILDDECRKTLGEFLGVKNKDLKFSCKGSWHNFRNDSSGFDVCHINCLSDLIQTRIRDNLRGLELFMNNYPEEGKVLTGNNKFKECWIDGEILNPSDYFARKGLGVPVKKT